MLSLGTRLLRASQAACLAIALVLPLSSMAATPASSTPSSEAPPIIQADPYGFVKLPPCFDYYRFGSVPVVLSADLTNVNAGAPFAVDAYIENQNQYPLVDSTVYVRVFKVRTLAKSVNGDDVVDNFVIADHVTLKAGEKKRISFIWNVPTDADPGAYRMTPFVVQEGRFNFLGLTFTDDVTGPSLDFSILNDLKGGTRFDRSGVSIAGITYHFAAFPPTVSPDTKDVQIYLPIANTGDKPYIGDITWKVYSWDASNPANLLAERTDKLSVGGHASTTLAYTVSDTSHAVYYVVAETTTKAGSHSIAAMRFVRPNVDPPRLAAVEATAYPLKSGSTAFACFHSGGTKRADNTSVTLSIETLPIFGLFSIPLASTHYAGIAPGSLVALTIPSKMTLGAFQVVASVSQNGKLVDRVATPYRCEDLGTCPTWLWPAALVLGAVAAGFLLWYLLYMKRTKRQRYTAAEHRTMIPPDDL